MHFGKKLLTGLSIEVAYVWNWNFDFFCKNWKNFITQELVKLGVHQNRNHTYPMVYKSYINLLIVCPFDLNLKWIHFIFLIIWKQHFSKNIIVNFLYLTMTFKNKQIEHDWRKNCQHLKRILQLNKMAVLSWKKWLNHLFCENDILRLNGAATFQKAPVKWYFCLQFIFLWYTKGIEIFIWIVNTIRENNVFII